MIRSAYLVEQSVDVFRGLFDAVRKHNGAAIKLALETSGAVEILSETLLRAREKPAGQESTLASELESALFENVREIVGMAGRRDDGSGNVPGGGASAIAVPCDGEG